MNSRLKIKVGAIELEFEGDGNFLKQNILGIVERLIKSKPNEDSSDDESAAESGLPAAGMLSTNTIASKLDAKDGPSLTIAALAHLQLYKGLSVAGRKQILEQMKSATGVYNVNMNKNFTSNTKSLMKADRINEISTGQFALTVAEVKKLKSAISGNK